jgi:hypothetical protein
MGFLLDCESSCLLVAVAVHYSDEQILPPILTDVKSV